MRVVAVVTMQAKPRTCCGAFTLFRMYRRGKSAGLTPAAVSMLGLGLSVFKCLRQADQHSAHERGIILRERVHDLQSSLARRTHGSLRFPCVRTERLLHLRARVSSPAWDVVKNGFPLLLGVVARLLGGLLDAVEELFFKRLELLESLFHARFLEARAAFGQFLQRDVIGFDHLYRLGGHRLEHLVRIDRWGFHLMSPAYSRVHVLSPLKVPVIACAGRR